MTDTIHKEMEARKRKGKWVELVNRRLEGEHEVAFSITAMFSSNWVLHNEKTFRYQILDIIYIYIYVAQLRPGGGSRVRHSGRLSTCEQQKKTGGSVVVVLGSARFNCVFGWVNSCWKCWTAACTEGEGGFGLKIQSLPEPAGSRPPVAVVSRCG